MVVISIDVIHSYTIPVLSFKINGMPSRINTIIIIIIINGMYHDQCSELYNIYHWSMPIELLIY